jgi:hypothetical protein
VLPASPRSHDRCSAAHRRSGAAADRSLPAPSPQARGVRNSVHAVVSAPGQRRSERKAGPPEPRAPASWTRPPSATSRHGPHEHPPGRRGRASRAGFRLRCPALREARAAGERDGAQGASWPSCAAAVRPVGQAAERPAPRGDASTSAQDTDRRAPTRTRPACPRTPRERLAPAAETEPEPSRGYTGSVERAWGSGGTVSGAPGRASTGTGARADPLSA